jgi:hypothetical protein
MKKPFLSNYESSNFTLDSLEDDSTSDTESIETTDYDYSIIDIIIED